MLQKPDLPHPAEVADAATGALLADRKAGLRKEVVGVRDASRSTEVDAISRRRLGAFRCELRCCQTEEVPLTVVEVFC